MKWVRRIVLLLLACGIGAAIYQAMQTPPVRVDVAAVTRGPLRVTVDEDGKTRIKERYVVSAPLAGRLLRIGIDPGDDVNAGDTIVARIEPSDPQLLNPRELATAEAREKAAEAALKRAEPLVQMAKADLVFAESELARVRKLTDSNAASASSLQNAERAYRNSAEAYRSATFSEEIARFELEQAQAALLPSRTEGTEPKNKEPKNAAAETDQRDTSDVDASDGDASDGDTADAGNSIVRSTESRSSSIGFEIPSPINGRVLRVFRESSAIVAAGQDLLEVGDPTDLELEIDILSSDAVQVRPGQSVIVDHWGGDRPLHGVVRLVEPSAFTKISALGVEEQRVNTIIDLTDPVADRETLGDGFRVEVRIIVWSAEDVLRVPTSALFKSDDTWFVFAVDHNTVRKAQVSIGHRNVEMAEVLAGLDEGQTVIVHPSDQITDGTLVELRPGGE